jgi:hypothetical protein
VNFNGAFSKTCNLLYFVVRELIKIKKRDNCPVFQWQHFNQTVNVGRQFRFLHQCQWIIGLISHHFIFTDIINIFRLIPFTFLHPVQCGIIRYSRHPYRKPSFAPLGIQVTKNLDKHFLTNIIEIELVPDDSSCNMHH